MKKKLQILLTEEAWNLLDNLTKEANDGFKNGHISWSDVINEILLTAKLDIRALQAKRTNIRKSLRLMASQKDIDFDSAIKHLMDLRSKSGKKTNKPSQSSFDEVTV